jgi:D-alanine-D-alanine ligase
MTIAVLFDDVDSRPDATPDERGVLEAVDAALSVLRSMGHHPVPVPAGSNPTGWVRTLEEMSPDAVLNLCEGLDGRSDGEILAARAVEALGLPLTGSPSGTLALARRKDRVNDLLEAQGLPVPPWALWGGSREEESPHGAPSSEPVAYPLGSAAGPGPEKPAARPTTWSAFPAIVKPAAEDGSVGITRESVVTGPEELGRRLEAAAAFAPLLVQAFVGTREINVGIVGREVLPLSEIVFRDLPPGYHPMIGYEAKWVPGSPEDLGTRPLCPAPLAPDVASKARALALKAWAAVDGRGYGRVDLRLTEPDTLHILEVNPNPDLAPSAGLARMAAAAGWSYAELLERILAEALPEPPPEAIRQGGAEALPEGSAVGYGLPSPPDSPESDIVLAPLDLMHRGPVGRILRAAHVFRDEEIEVALEVLDAYYAHPGQDYHALGAFTPGGELLGYTVFGPTPCTLGTWDLYWIAVSPETQGTGVGTILLKEVEGRLTRSNARLLIIETSSRPPYDPTRAFYEKRGYREVARIHDFYEDGDHRVIYAKNLTVRPEQA